MSKDAFWVRGLGIIYPEEIEDAQRHLTERQWVALRLWIWEGRTHAEIAEELGIKRPAVTRLISRAKNVIKRHVGGSLSI